MIRVLFGIFLMLLSSGSVAVAAQQETVNTDQEVRVCVIGGMTMTGLWDEIAARFEEQTGYRVTLVSTGQRSSISETFRSGEVDFLVMHSGDITTDLVADGYGINMRPCARNDLVIVGPADDPAAIRGLGDGAEALRRIAEKQANFIDFNSNGPRELGHTLWSRAGIRPVGSWFVQDEAKSSHDILLYAAEYHAYVIFGRMPFTWGKVATHGLEILVDSDPTMRRPYVLMTANPERLQGVNLQGAEALADFILSQQIQAFMATYGCEKNGGFPFFYPVWPYAGGVQGS
jgi:tungstate transport system substrate-binding protein